MGVLASIVALCMSCLLVLLVLQCERSPSFYNDVQNQKKLMEGILDASSSNSPLSQRKQNADRTGAEFEMRVSKTPAIKHANKWPGSWPPTCTNKCLKCRPCMLVRVPVKPGKAPSPAEYYPEAWRCRCNGNLYIP